ncbi:MAG: zinc-ribbon domain-containing protein [Polyangiaceae bacterium]
MDVRCNRCATEYEFDDALISERGTTVKCTNCGFQFKVFPSKSQAQEPERWLVKCANGKELVYTSLRELQRGIAERQVGPNDLLSRGRQPPRSLGSIAELEPFFADPTQKPGGRAPRTLAGVAPAAAHLGASATPPPVNAVSVSEPEPSTRRVLTQAGLGVSSPPPVAAKPEPAIPRPSPVAEPELAPVPTPPPAPAEVAAELPESAISDPTPTPQAIAVTEPATPRATLDPAVVAATELQPVPNSSGALPMREYMLTPSSPFAAPPISPELMPASSPFASGPISAGRRDLRSYDELTHEEIHEHGRRARSRWIAAFVIAGVTTLFAVTVGRRYLLESASSGAQPNSASSARVAELLREGNRLLGEGDVEGASEQLLRASALAEKDRSVLAALAQLETLRADATWLKLRLLDPNLTDVVQGTHRELGRRVGKARIAADAAFAVAPEDMVVLRARVDTLRLSGDADKAREWIKPIAANGSDPQNAYVLAALDLSDPNPGWESLIDRLRIAVSGERSAGRAHAALVYALARSGKLSEAETELSKLEANQSALLLDELRGFLKRHSQKVDAGVAAPVAMVDPGKLGKLDTTQVEEPRAAASARGALNPSVDSAKASSGDFRKQLTDAGKALAKGDLSQAESLYQKVLNEQPNATEALAGLADVARRRNDPSSAAKLYDRVLANNPGYLPALMARGDQEWAAGNRDAAVGFYRRVVDHSGAGSSYGQRAAARIAEHSGAPAAEKAAPVEKTAPPSADKPAQPEVDTSDLPGFK